MDPDVAAEVETQLRRVLKTGERIVDSFSEAEIPAQPGVRRTFQHTFHPVAAEDGTIIGVSCLIQEISDRRRAEDALKRSAHIIEHTGVALVISSPDGTIEALNPAALRMYQASPDDLKHLRDIYALEVRDQLEKFSASVNREGHISFESKHRRKDGTVFPVQVSVTAVHSSAQQVEYRIATVEDISERVVYREHLEELVRERTTDLEFSRAALDTRQRLASLGTLAAGIAHQLNNPLGSILNAAQFAEQCRGDPSFPLVAEEALADIIEQARRGGRIVRSVLQFSRGEPTEKWRQDLDQTIERSCRLVRDYAEEHGATVVFEPHGSSPVVEMNPLEIEQALVNLLRNGIESQDHGSTVTLERQVVGDWVRLTIRDNGHGIDEKDLPRILDPFFTTRLDAGGTGLGLSVAHGIITGHGGALEIESNPTGGTAVCISLPVTSA